MVTEEKENLSNLQVNNPICPKNEVILNLTAVLITCKSDEDLIKNEIIILQTTFYTSMGPSRMGTSHANSLKWAKIELVQDFMPCLSAC